MALDKELHPYLLVTINSLGLEQLMEIRSIADDVTTGWFRFFKAESWRQLCNHWTNACRAVVLRQLSDI